MLTQAERQRRYLVRHPDRRKKTIASYQSRHGDEIRERRRKRSKEHVRPTPAALGKLLSYDPATGLFLWRRPTARQPSGWFKGGKGVRSYRRIWIDGKGYLAHVVAWVLMTGKWPRAEIDHRNRVQDDNRWAELRPATHTQNGRNRSLGKNNTTGVLGVSKYGDRYRAVITVNRQNISLGLFNDVANAAAVRKQAEDRYYGEFAP